MIRLHLQLPDPAEPDEPSFPADAAPPVGDIYVWAGEAYRVASRRWWHVWAPAHDSSFPLVDTHCRLTLEPTDA